MDELELEFNPDELEVIEKLLNVTSFNYPALYIGTHAICFNVLSKSIVPERIKWLCSTDYIIGIPADEDEYNAFKVRNGRISKCNNTCCKLTYIPSVMKNEKKIKSGYYKLYKYKDGFAFKRNEQINTHNRKEERT